MVTKVTKGIKISVETKFEGSIYREHQLFQAFSYTITIENLSKDTIQLLNRFWEIRDALKLPEYVEGEGVIGKKPVIPPQQKHSYSSGCLLSSPIGSMNGYYEMLNFSTGKTFKVSIPNFKLSTPFILN